MKPLVLLAAMLLVSVSVEARQTTTVPQINSIDAANITQLNSEGAGLDTGALPGRIFNDLVGTTVVFDAVVMTDPLSSGLANHGGGDPDRLHVFVRDITGSSGLGQDSRGIQLVDGNYQGTGLINVDVGDVIRIDAIVSPFGNTMQLAPNSITLLGTASSMGLSGTWMDPVLVSTGDLNESLPPGVQANWDRLADLRGEYVRIENAVVTDVQYSASRPQFMISSDGGTTQVPIDGMSLRFRNDRSTLPDVYPAPFNILDTFYEPPAIGSVVNLQGFVALRGVNPFGTANPHPAILSIAPFSDGDLEVVSLAAAPDRPPYPATDDFLMFVDGRNVEIPDFNGDETDDPDDASNRVARFAYQDWASKGFYWDSATGTDLSRFISDGPFDGSSLFLRLWVDQSLAGRGPLSLTVFDSQSGPQGPRADLESGALQGDLEFRAKWEIPERYRNGQWHDLEIPLPPNTEVALRDAQWGLDPRDGSSAPHPVHENAGAWYYGGSWAGGFGVWDSSDPLWEEFDWSKVRGLTVHFDFADGGGGEVLLDDVYIGAPGTDLTVATSPASAPSGVAANPSGDFNQITWTGSPDQQGFNVYAFDRPFGGPEILAGEALKLNVFNQLGAGDSQEFHQFEVPHGSLAPMDLHYAVTSLSAFGVENTAVSSVSIANPGLLPQGAIVEVEAAGASQLGASLGAGLASMQGMPATAPFVIDYENGRWRWGGDSEPDDNADASGTLWGGFSRDEDALFFYAEITDETISRTPAGTACPGCDAWAYDSVELGWGSYDVTQAPGGSLMGPSHDSFLRGATPDYQLRFAWLDDGSGTATVNTSTAAPIPGATVVFEDLNDGGGSRIGYKFLARVPFGGIRVSHPGDALFAPPDFNQVSYVPFNFAINDQDNSGSRESQIQWSLKPNATGSWWNTPSEWPAVAVAAAPPPPLTADVDFEVDITPLELIGVFDPATDIMELRGSHNGWSCSDPSVCEMAPQSDGVWSLTVPITSQPGDEFEYKFFANLDPNRFSPDPVPPGWEEPAQTGGANRLFTFDGQPLPIPVDHFSDYLPGNVIPAATSVDAVFSLDMTGAPGFTAGVDKPFIILGQDGLWAYTQGISWGEPYELTDPDGDGVYTFTFPVAGPTFGGIQYTYAFGSDAANFSDEEQGGGFSEPGRKRLRWISPGQQGYPATFEFPLDTYQPTGALPVEENPLEILAVDDNPTGSEDNPLSIDVLANDVDPLGLGLTIIGVTDPQTGTVEVPTSAAGTVIYRGPAEFSGSDVFTYTMSDASGQSATGTVYVTIAAVNDPPRAVPDKVSTNKSVALTFSPLANDTDIEGNAISLVSVNAPTGGSISVSGNSVTYTPNPGFSGSDNFEYVITDGTSTARGAILMTVNDVNVAPTAADDSASTTEETSVSIPVLSNDTDVDGDALTIASLTQPAEGSAADNGDGSITYAPGADFEGTDQFTYTIQDPEGLSATATVTVTVTGVNDPPTVVDDIRVAFTGIAATYDVLSNDTDPDGDALTITAVSPPLSGTTTIVGGRLRYEPGGATTANDSFTYTASDGRGGSDTGTVTVTIQGLPADDDGVEEAVEAGAPNGGDGNGDGIPDSEQANVASLPSATSGSYISVASEPGSEIVGVTSSPDPPSPPEDPPPAEASFQTGFLDFQLKGGTGNAAKTVTITASDPFNTYYKYGPTPDNPTPHWYQFLYDGETGAVINGNTLTLHFIDGKRGDDDLTVNGVIVDPGAPALIPNELPVAGADALEIDEDSSGAIDLILNDSDPDGDVLSIASIGLPTSGTAVLSGSTVTYTPTPEFSGTDSFEYVLSDGRGGTVTGLVTITVTSINDLPVAAADAFTTDEDVPMVITTLLANDTDAEGADLSLVRVFAADQGLVSFSNDGTITYTPPADFSGEDRFTYSISDGIEEGAPGTVTISVTAVNDAPTAVADFLTLEGGETSVGGNVLGNDSDVDSETFTVIAVGAAEFGTVTFTAEGDVVYTPGSGFGTSDSFTYTVTDAEGASSEAVVSIALGAVAPHAMDDGVSLEEDSSATIEVLANDSDSNGDDLTLVSVGTPSNGTAEINDEGLIVYTPNPDFNGTDSFSYTVSDGGLESTATVTVTISSVDDAPRFEEGSPVFVTPVNGADVLVGNPNPDTPAGRLETIAFEFNGATDPEGASVTYEWELSLEEGMTDPIHTESLAETSFTLPTRDVAGLMGDTPGVVLTVYHRVTASDGELETASAVESATLIRGYVTGVDDEAIPEEFELHQNYPNPFNPRTTIKYAVPQTGRVSILMFDTLGREVATLLDGQATAGYHDLSFDASSFPSGLYIYVMRAEGFLQSKGMILLR